MRRQAAVQKEWCLQKPLETFIVDEVELNTKQASQLCDLFKQGAESAYIARYRGDVHGGLAPEDIRKALDAYFDALELNKKVNSALNTVTAKVEGSDEKKAVAERLKQCEDVQEVTEITKEFSTGTRKTKANVAKEFGLEPAAKLILDGSQVDLKTLTSKEVKTEKEAGEHLKICLADMINRSEDVKKMALRIARLGVSCGLRIETKLTREAMKKKEEKEMETHLKKYENYIGRSWSAHKIMDHQVSALNRAVEEGILSWSADLPEGEARRLHPLSKHRVHPAMIKFYQEALAYSISTYFSPKVERATKKFLSERSMARSIHIFGENVEQLFAQQGVHSKFVIALDPGSAIKTAFLKPNGSVIAMDHFGIHHQNFDQKGTSLLKKWAGQTEGKDLVFAVGNGCNSYNTQCAIAKMIEKREFPAGIDVCFCVVPEDGASKYSCTAAAREEFGEKAEITQISAVSIGRRLLDPMSEYVKIEPQHLGKGQYQLSANEKLLKQKLSQVVRDRVSMIGANLNEASKHLLQQICGLNEATAAGIVKYREENGRFGAREELKKVKGIGAVAFQQCAGFLTVSNPEDSESGPPAKKRKVSSKWQPLDGTIVHPDDYESAEKILKKLKMTVEDVISGKKWSAEGLTPEETRILELMSMRADLKPPPPMLKKVRTTRDLAIGQQYTAVVRNKTDFGVFVDFGVERNGLVHISCFKKKNCELPHVGEQLEVVVDDLRNNKISLRLVA